MQSMLSSYAISDSTRKFVFQNLASSVIRYYGQLSSCTISEENNDPILRKLSDRETNGQTEVQTEGRE